MNKRTKERTWMIGSGILVTLSFLFGVQDVYACRAPRPSPEGMAADADAVVRAKARGYVKSPPDTGLTHLYEPPDAEVGFTVKEILKGDAVPREIVLNGYVTDRDDFNDVGIPYNFVRPGGRGGSCSAYEYRKGAEFLLFLKKIDGKYTIRWYALAPTNEQLRSSDDEWIRWTRSYLRNLKK